MAMTADIKHTLALLWSTWEDLPKTKADLQGYGDNELEMLEALSDKANTEDGADVAGAFGATVRIYRLLT